MQVAVADLVQAQVAEVRAVLVAVALEVLIHHLHKQVLLVVQTLVEALADQIQPLE